MIDNLVRDPSVVLEDVEVLGPAELGDFLGYGLFDRVSLSDSGASNSTTRRYACVSIASAGTYQNLAQIFIGNIGEFRPVEFRDDHLGDGKY